MDLTRRAVLKAGGASGVASLSGCLNSPFADGGGNGEGYAAFFALWDWAQAVSGSHVDFKNPVKAGQRGHGWSPQGDITRNIASTEIFVYIDNPDFSWAQDIASELSRDYEDVLVVDLFEAVRGRLLRLDEDPHDEQARGDVVEADDRDGSDKHVDPHAWVDPVLAQEMVDTIADALAEIDPENEATYRDNAAAYTDRQASVHRQFENLVDTADRNVAVLAAHDSFRYLEARYGFELRTPVGTSPDAAESFDDISGLIDTIEAHDIETVLYNPFATPDAGEDLPQIVELLFEHSDIENAEPLSPTDGTTAAWDENGWGWVEQMEEINLPALRMALGADEQSQTESR